VVFQISKIRVNSLNDACSSFARITTFVVLEVPQYRDIAAIFRVISLSIIFPCLETYFSVQWFEILFLSNIFWKDFCLTDSRRMQVLWNMMPNLFLLFIQRLRNVELIHRKSVLWSSAFVDNIGAVESLVKEVLSFWKVFSFVLLQWSV